MKLSFGFALLVTIATLGCGGGASDLDRVPTHPVTGVVTLNGTPVEGAQVTFNPEARDGRGAFGLTDAEGRYELATFEAGDGAVAGKYIVTMAKYDTPPAPEGEVSEEEYVPPEAGGGAAEAPPKNLLPDQYRQMHTSNLRAEVKEGDNTFDFALSP